MIHFHSLYHGNCALSYVGGVLELTKLDFGGLKSRFGVKKASFGGLIAKVGYFRPILDSKTNLLPFFIVYVMGTVP